jgi:hypothetical protein
VLLTVAGLQVPVTPLVEVVGKRGAAAPLQMAAMVAKEGVTIGFTVTTNEVVETHAPLLAVKI